MVRFHGGRALTVRDDPQMYLESNRKPGSKSRSVESPPYFYFLFGLRGPKNVIFGRLWAGLAPYGSVVPKSLLYFVRLMDLNILVFNSGNRPTFRGDVEIRK